MAAGSPITPMLRFNGKVGRCHATILIDSGATLNFISDDFITKNRIKTNKITGPKVLLADGTTYHCESILPSAEIMIGAYRCRTPLYILPLHGHDVILGTHWLTHTNPSINWKDQTVTIREGGKVFRLQPERRPIPTSADGDFQLLSERQAHWALRRGGIPILA